MQPAVLILYVESGTCCARSSCGRGTCCVCSNFGRMRPAVFAVVVGDWNLVCLSYLWENGACCVCFSCGRMGPAVLVVCVGECDMLCSKYLWENGICCACSRTSCVRSSCGRYGLAVSSWGRMGPPVLALFVGEWGLLCF